MREYHLNLKKINRDTSGIIILELSGLKNQAIFNFKPGQYVMLSYKNRDGLVEDKHAFSIASSPIRNTYLRLGIKIGGNFTQGLLNLAIGQEVIISGPYGHFIFDEKKTPSPVFIAGGIGITPFISSLNYVADKRLLNNISLIYSAKNSQTAAFLDEIKNLQVTHPNLTTLINFTENSGRLTVPIISDFIGDINGKTFYLCGPSPFMKNMSDNLRLLGVAKKNIEIEAFSMIPDQGFLATFKNIAYASAFALALFLPIFYLINFHPKATDTPINNPGNAINNKTTTKVKTNSVNLRSQRVTPVVSRPVPSTPAPSAVTIPSTTDPQPRTRMS